MTIEITAAETEALIASHLRTGEFQSVDELLAKALVALREKEPVGAKLKLSNSERRKLEGRKSLPELFAESPLNELDLDFSRNRSTGTDTPKA